MSHEQQTERVKEVFSYWAKEGRADRMAETHTPSVRPAFDRIELEEDSWYLDIGCGNGYTVRWAAPLVPRGRAFGLDISLTMIEKARELSQQNTNVEFLCAPFPDTALPEDRFHAILSMEAFYYFPDLDEALTRVKHLLRPGGTFTCVVDYYAENTASHTWPREMDVKMRLLSALGWQKAFEKNGLTVTEQSRIKLPADEASTHWKTTQGSLLTVGTR